MSRKKLLIGFVVAVVTLVGVIVSSPKVAYAACSQPSAGPYPPHYTYSDSFSTLVGDTWVCWSGEYYYHKGRTFGALYGPTPFSKIRVTGTSWEETDGVWCAGNWNWDSGWKYNQYDTGEYGSTNHHYVCTGGGSHYYVGLSTHSWGDSITANTSVK